MRTHILVVLAIVSGLFFQVTAGAQTSVVTFDNPAPSGAPDSALNGTFQGINFGTGQWRWSGPYAVARSNSIYFASSAGTSRTLTFSSGPRTLDRIIVYTATGGTLTLSDGVNPAMTRSIATGSLHTVSTGWSQSSATVTIAFTGGWALGIDEIASSSTASSPPASSDTVPPMVSVSAPGAGTTVTGSVAVNATAFDAVGVTGVQFLLDGNNLGTEDTVAPYSTTWNTVGSPNGSHTLLAVARDAAGNRTTSSSVTVNVSNAAAGSGGYGLRFFGTGTNDIDRVKIRVDDPATTVAGPPADIGSTDFTIEFWLNTTDGGPAINCSGYEWIRARTIIDRDRYNQDRAFGIAMTSGRIAFGVAGQGTGRSTICSSGNIADGKWHHVAVQRRRSDGWMWIYVDGALQAQGNGPDGDISYPDNGVPGPYCGTSGSQACTASDPFLVIGAEKHDAGTQSYPSYRGLFDELRLSRVLRYSETASSRPTQPFVADANTVGLYHFNEGQGTVINDSSGAAGGPSQGVRNVGGGSSGPAWVTTTPF